MKKTNENQKITLTLGQLKRLIKENLWDDVNKDAEPEAPLPTIDELMRFLAIKASQATQAAERLACNGFLGMLEKRYNAARFVAEKILKDYNEMHGTAIPLKDKNKDSLKETLIKELMQKWFDTYKAGLKTIYASESSKDNLVKENEDDVRHISIDVIPNGFYSEDEICAEITKTIEDVGYEVVDGPKFIDK